MKSLTCPQLREFSGRLEEVLDLREVGGDLTWDCAHDHAATRRILAEMGLPEREIDAACAEFEALGGFCDCEIVLNVIGRELAMEEN
jgi:hypothetical protein